MRGQHLRRIQPALADPADRLQAGIPRLDQIADLEIARRHLARGGADTGIGGKAEDIGIVPGQVGPATAVPPLRMISPPADCSTPSA